jgi:trk system potassium uptake protein
MSHLNSCLKLRVDNECKTKLVAQIFGLLAVFRCSDSRVEAIEFFVSENSNVTDIPLRDLKLKKHLLICFINRNGKIIIPTGNDCIQKNDTVMIITTHTGFTNLQDIME